MNKCIVTGGAGFIGSHLVKRLVSDGKNVLVIDNLSSGNVNSLRDVRDKISFVKADVRNRNALRTLFDDADLVFHLAAIVSVPRSIKDPETTHDVNVTGTFNVLAEAKAANVRRVILSSTCAVYGNGEQLPKHENLTPTPLSPYASSKYMAEVYAKMFCDVYDLQTVCLRYFNVYGPGQRLDSEYAAVIPRLTWTMFTGQRPVIFGDGNQTRDFIYIEDVVSANMAASVMPNISGEVINIGSATESSINDLVQIVNTILGSNLSPLYRPQRTGDIRQSLASIDKCRRLLLLSPSTSIREGLRRTLETLAETSEQTAATISRVP